MSLKLILILPKRAILKEGTQYHPKDHFNLGGLMIKANFLWMLVPKDQA